ncbi:Transcription factor bye1 [Malassezia caprae]|uniref:Transcription factor bye1 n=1 Tax=Malassezia caprae TaxID=1381934 RepID=A0AAF0E8Z0_9BASI|nr:Transcription factor bye1 [Malassezia caprae]
MTTFVMVANLKITDNDEDEDEDEEEDTPADDHDAELTVELSDASESSRPRSTRVKRMKRAPAKSARRSGTAVDDDPVRRHVLSTFTSIFKPLFTAKGLDAEDAASYAAELEGELFHAHGTDPHLRAYKERFRTLHFNLKDPRNVTLHERVTSGQLPAKDIVHMSNEALANDAIREATEKAKRDALQQAVLLRDKEGPARKITHKGEVDIERDEAAFAPKESRSIPAADPEPEPEPEPDSNAEASAMPSSPTFTPAKEHDDMSPLPESDSFTGLWDKQATTIPEEAPMDEPAADLGIDAPTEADSFIDSFLGDERPSSSLPDAKAKAPEETDTAPDMHESHTPAGTPPPDSFIARWAAQSKNALSGSPVVWDGVVTMPEYTSAYVHVRTLSHPRYAPEAQLWRDCFPTPERTVEGRLPSQVAIDYLAQVRMSPRNEIVVLALDAGGATPASERHEGISTLHSSPALDKLVHYFADKQRFGVLAPAPGTQGSLVKDFYLAPLLAHEPVPEWLTMLSPEGLGDAWTAQRPAHMLFVILVLFKAAMKGKTTAPPAPVRSSADESAAAASSAPVSLDTLLNVKPDAIQNLLSTLKGGGGASPLNAMGTPPPMATPPPGPGPPGPPGVNGPPGPPPMLPMHGLPPPGRCVHGEVPNPLHSPRLRFHRR